MQTLAGRRLQKSLSGFLVMPRLEGIAGFHSRKNVNQTGMFSSLLEYLFYSLLVAEILLLNEVNCHAIVPRSFFSMGSDIFPKLHCPVGILEYKNPLLPDKPCHGFGMSNRNQRAGYYDPVKARKRKGNLFGMAFDKRVHGYRLSHQPCSWQLPYTA
jgi:hypothetical protein